MQDLVRSPLVEGQTLAGWCVFGILAVFKRKAEGTDVWNNFDKAAKAKGSDGETLLSNEGVQVTHAKVVGKPKARRTVAPTDVPSFLAVVCGKSALSTLEGQDLLETLVARGLDRDRAQALLSAQIQKLQEKPEDVATLAQVSQVFGTPLEAVRHMRTPKRNGEGTVFVMSAIDLVMAARGCDYATAQSIVFHIFKDYYKVDLEAENHVENQVNGNVRIILMFKVRFFTGERGSSSLALDVQGACELLCVIPGSDFGAAVRRRAVDTLLRVEGGDESLIDRIQANRKFQEYLAQHDPDHPLRAVGEHAERRQVEEAVPEAHRRAEMELVLGHKKRMLDLELETAQKKACLEMAPQRSACLPEVCLDWVKDLGVCRNELAGVKSQFKTLLQIDIASGRIPTKSTTEAWIKSPPVRFKDLADGAVASYRSLLRQRYDAIAVGCTSSGMKKTGKRLRSQSSESISEDEDDILRISEVMRVAGVWTAVWSSFRSDLANQMLSLKCAETDGNFSERRQETVQGHIPVLVHKYKKSSDWPLAWRALQNTRDVYQKRVREFLESMYILAGYPADGIEHASAELARAIAVSLRVMPTSN